MLIDTYIYMNSELCIPCSSAIGEVNPSLHDVLGAMLSAQTQKGTPLESSRLYNPC